MEHRQNRRAQQTRDQIRAASYRLFLQHGYLGTSTDAILAEAGIVLVDVVGRFTSLQSR